MSDQNTIEKKYGEKLRPSENKTSRSETGRPAAPRHKRIAALLGVILLGALYLITLIAAIFDKSSSGSWFLLCLIGTVVIPLLIWIYTWMYGVLTGRRTIASLEPKDCKERGTREPNIRKSDDAHSETQNPST